MIHVLDKGFVKLTDFMGSDLSVVNTARISYDKQSKQLDDKDKKLLDYLWKHKHTSPFRHCMLQFHIKAPIFVLRQWMKHVVGCAWNEKSGRYVKFNVECYRPEIFREQHKTSKQSSFGEIDRQGEALDVYDSVINQAVESYHELLDLGVCKEQARMILPLNLYTECYWTASLQAVMNFLELREDTHSQWEIQQYAHAVRKLSEGIFQYSLGELK